MSAAAYLAAAKRALPAVYPKKERGGTKKRRFPPAPSPLRNSLGAPGDSSPVVACGTTAPHRAEIRLRLELTDAHKTVQSWLDYLAQADREAGIEQRRPLTGMWATLCASPRTVIRQNNTATVEYGTPPIRQALWRAFVADLVKVSGQPRSVLFSSSFVLYNIVGLLRRGRPEMRTMRKDHAPFRAQGVVEAVIALDLADMEAEDRAAALAAQRAASPAAMSVASPVAPCAAASPAVPVSASPAVPGPASPAAHPSASPTVQGIAQPTAPAPETTREPLKPVNTLKRSGDPDVDNRPTKRRATTTARLEGSEPDSQRADSNTKDGRHVQSANNFLPTSVSHAPSGGQSAALPPASGGDWMECDPPSGKGDEARLD